MAFAIQIAAVAAVIIVGGLGALKIAAWNFDRHTVNATDDALTQAELAEMRPAAEVFSEQDLRDLESKTPAGFPARAGADLSKIG
jgi:hypothetical protein